MCQPPHAEKMVLGHFEPKLVEQAQASFHWNFLLSSRCRALSIIQTTQSICNVEGKIFDCDGKRSKCFHLSLADMLSIGSIAMQGRKDPLHSLLVNALYHPLKQGLK